MDNIYEENFVKSNVPNDPEAIKYIIDQIAEVHSSDKGWTMSEPQITLNNDNKTVTIVVHLTQYKDQIKGRSR